MSYKLQAIAFNKKYFTKEKAKVWLHEHKYKPISNRTVKNFYRFRLVEPNEDKYKYRVHWIDKDKMFLVLEYPKNE